MSEPRSGDAGATNEPAGQSPPYEQGAAARTSENPPPGTNQPATEPMPADQQSSSPDTGNLPSANAQAPSPIAVSATGTGGPRATAQPRSSEPTASRTPGIQGEPPEQTEVDRVAEGERAKPGRPPASTSGTEDTHAESAGNAHGVSVAADESLAGSTEDSNEVRGLAAPGPASSSAMGGGTSPGGTAQQHRRSAPDGEVSPT